MGYTIETENILLKTKLPSMYRFPIRNNYGKKNLMDFMVRLYDVMPKTACKPTGLDYWEVVDDGIEVFSFSPYASFSVLKLDANNPKYVKNRFDIEWNGYLEVRGYRKLVEANEDFILVEYENFPEKDKLLKAFREF